MADDDTTPQVSLGDIKHYMNELRQARKLNTIRLNAGLKYVSTKLEEESTHRASIHEKLTNQIQISQSELEKEKEKTRTN